MNELSQNHAIDQKLESITAHPDFADLKVIDVDTHWSEPWDLWTSQTSGKLKDQVPRVVEKDGDQYWVIGEDEAVIHVASPSSVIDTSGKKIYGGDFLGTRMHQVHQASYDLDSRLAFMDLLGIHAQILYPNVAGVSFAFIRSSDAKLRTTCAKIYNDSAIRFQESTNGRVLPMAVIPYWERDDALKELERCVDMGFHGIAFAGDVHKTGQPSLGQDYWTPFWEACNQYKVPINFHIGGSEISEFNMANASWPEMGQEEWLALGTCAMLLDNMRTIGNLIYSGVPERFPNLRFVSVESGVSWIPFFLQTLDYQLNETAPAAKEKLTMAPSEYFKRNFYASFWFEKDIQPAIDMLGDDHIMFETDFPHPTCLYPSPLDYLRNSVVDLPSDVQRKLLQDNAAKLYNIDIT